METFGIRIYKEYFNFAAAHFLIFADGRREELHGHNYQVEMQMEGKLDANQDVFIDFLHIKPIVKSACNSIDHRTLLPQGNSYITIEHLEDKHVKVTFADGKDYWIFPERDVVILPVSNTSVEWLARYLCFKILETLKEQYPDAVVSKIELSVEESRGQAAIYRQEYPEPKQLKTLWEF